jgi:DnaJ-class molecular chaperone
MQSATTCSSCNGSGQTQIKPSEDSQDDPEDENGFQLKYQLVQLMVCN